MNAITFSLVPVPEEIAAGRKVYRAYVKTNGSFDSEDAPFDPKRNTLYVGASLSQELRDRRGPLPTDKMSVGPDLGVIHK